MEVPGPEKKRHLLAGLVGGQLGGRGAQVSRAPGPPDLLRDAPAITETGLDRGREFQWLENLRAVFLGEQSQSVALLQKGPENKQRSLLVLVFN